MRDKPKLKRRLVTAILGSSKEPKTLGWALSEAYQRFIARPAEDVQWQPELDYYVRLIQKLVESKYYMNSRILEITSNIYFIIAMAGTAKFPPTDWRFNEFPNPAAHTLYITCVELMALPVPPNVIANSLLDVVAKG